MPQWHRLATPPAELFTGGPVARNALIGLVRLASRADGVTGASGRPTGWRLLVDAERPVGTVDLAADPAGVAPSIVGARLFSGYAGWEAGQLEDEIAEGSWYVVRGRSPRSDLGRPRGSLAPGPPSPGRCARTRRGLSGRPGGELKQRPPAGPVRAADGSVDPPGRPP